MRPRPNKRRTIKPIIPQSLKTINSNTAGIDVGSTEMYVAVPADRDSQSVRIFRTFTADLHELAQWLLACRISQRRDGIDRRVLDPPFSTSCKSTVSMSA